MVNQSGAYSVIVSNIYSSILSSQRFYFDSDGAFTITTQPTNRVTWLGGFSHVTGECLRHGPLHLRVAVQ